MSKVDVRRAQILGSLIKDARVYARRSPTECARVVGISVEDFGAIESGELPVSLPQLEALAIYLKVPMSYFWGSDTLNHQEEPKYADFILLRHRVIGVLLRQLRLRARHSTADLAEELGVSVATIEAYEAGQTPIPFLHLEQLCRFLEISIVHFVDDERGPLARHEMEQQLRKQFERLPAEIQDFIAKPGNISYLETAYKLSEMDVQRLRQVAEAILDITF